VDNLEIAPEIRKLYQYLVDKGCIEQLNNHNPDHLQTFSREVLRKIEAGDQSWIEHVPAEVARVIQQRGFFGCRHKAPESRLSAMIAPVDSDVHVCTAATTGQA
jgi:hypothetical protein